MEFLKNGVDLLLCNQHEAELFCESEDIKTIQARIIQFAKQIVITKGGAGATLYDGETFHDISTDPVTVLDTTGAGDTFAGAYLYGIANDENLVSTTRFANKMAGFVVAQYGPRLPVDVYERVKGMEIKIGKL